MLADAVGVDAREDRDHQPGPGRDRDTRPARRSESTSSWPSAEIAAGRPSKRTPYELSARITSGSLMPPN